MKEILTRNLSLKIVSVVIAFFVWMAVVYVSDPQVTGRQEITLEVVNDDVLAKAGLAYEVEGKRSSVSLTYRIHTRDRANVAASDFRAYIDLADYYPATGTVPVYVEVLNNKSYLLESVTARPAVVRIKTEQIQKKDFDLQIHQTGRQADEYEVERILLDEEIVTLEGPESVIGRISSVGVEIPVDGLYTDTSGTVIPKFYDANHNELGLDSRVTINVPEIHYTVKIMKRKQIPLEFEVSGHAADGYRYVGMESSVTEVTVLGVDAVVSMVDSIKIPSGVLDLDGAAEDKIITIDAEDYLPDQANMSIPWNSQVTVTLKVRQLSRRSIEISTNRIIREGEQDEYYYDYDKDTIEVTVEGLEEDLNTLDGSDIVMEMDVSRLGTGSHRGILTFEGLQDGFEVVSYSDFRVIVTSKEYGPGGVSSEAESSQEEGTLGQGDDHSSAGVSGETGAGESSGVTVHGESVSDGWPLNEGRMGDASEAGAFYDGAAEGIGAEHNTEMTTETEWNSQ